ncbi:hypothetical protein [Maricaulis sp.]|uniref:hypothetical protein n=1 Tax=Maricaulis sp. TaxID=1486257 RepID=UPI002616705D|nr:hypothetical protein [Maricaulis sp.]
MTSEFRIFDAMFFSVKRFGERPLAFLVFIASVIIVPWAVFAGLEIVTGQGYLERIEVLYSEMMLVEASSGGLDMVSFVQLWGELMLIQLVIGTVVFAGLNRLLVRDTVNVFLPLQLGLDELRYLVLHLFVIAISIVVMIGLFIVMIPLSMIMLPLMAGGMQSGDPLMTIIGALAIQLPVMAIGLYIYARILPVYTLTTRDRRLRLGAWKATSGVGVKLFLALGLPYLVLTAVILGVQFSIMPTEIWQSGNVAAGETIAQFVWSPAYLVLLGLYGVMLFILSGPAAYVAVRDDSVGDGAEEQRV